GYSELRPAANFWKPGTVAVLDGKSMDPICWQDESLGAGVAGRVVTSGSLSDERVSRMTAKFDIDAAYLAQIKASARAVENINFRLTNVQVHTLSWTTIQSSYKDRSSACTEAIARATAEHMPLAMLTSVIQADIIYTVTFDNSLKLSVDAKVDALHD